MILGWKTQLAKKIVETVAINLAMLAAQEAFREGLAAVKAKFKKEEPKVEEESEETEESEEEESEEEESTRRVRAFVPRN